MLIEHTLQIVTPEQWHEERLKLLADEKAHTKQADELAKRRMNLPMTKAKEYQFTGPNGTVSLADMFHGRRQLVLYHAMFDPSWEAACKSCSFLIDQLPQHLQHLHARNTTLVLVSRAEFEKLAKFKTRMGWNVDWYSSAGSQFNYDFHATVDEDVIAPAEYNYTTAAHLRGEQPGFSVFFKDGGEVYHSYSCYGRGPDHLLTTYALLDMTPLGRQDPDMDADGEGLGFKFHDEY